MVIHALDRKTTIYKNEEPGTGLLVCLNSIGENAPLKTDGQIYVLSEILVPVGFGMENHFIEDGSELIYVLEGELYCIDNGEPYLMHHGDCSYCREGERLAYHNRSESPVLILRLCLNKQTA